MRRQPGSEDLDRDQATQLTIPGTVDLAHATAAKQLHQLITAREIRTSASSRPRSTTLYVFPHNMTGLHHSALFTEPYGDHRGAAQHDEHGNQEPQRGMSGHPSE
jgi:hypothetical protein